MTEWIDSAKELPPYDGDYEVSGFVDNFYDKTIMQYDGIGFFHIYAYYEPKYWRYIPSLRKRYGKNGDQND